MKKKNHFKSKLLITAIMMGIFSPAINIGSSGEKPQVTLSIFKQAVAREKRPKPKPPHARPPHYKPKPPHHKPRPPHARPPHYKPKPHNYYYAPKKYHHRYYHGRRIMAFAAGLAIGSIITSATMPPSCTTIRVNGISYRRCNNSYYRPFYDGDTLVYEVVPSPY